MKKFWIFIFAVVFLFLFLGSSFGEDPEQEPVAKPRRTKKEKAAAAAAAAAAANAVEQEAGETVVPSSSLPVESTETELRSDLNIRFGNKVIISHPNTGNTLHSHKYRYAAGSKQQQVTSIEPPTDDNDIWLIKPQNEKDWNKKLGKPLQSGDIVRLEHYATSQLLHSHSNYRAPQTKHNQEVTAFCEAHTHKSGDDNDLWEISLLTNKKGPIFEGERVSIKHLNTQKHLHTHKNPFVVYGKIKQNEVSCATTRDGNTEWTFYASESNSLSS